MRDEVKRRIEYLNEGPWIEKGRLAWEKIAMQPGVASNERPNSETQTALKELLRAHWTESIVRHEGIIRDSFDEALTIYQLYELAIENRYIEIIDIKQRVAAELTRLLWSDGARDYLKIYGYVSVIYLAQRVGLNLGFRQVVLPPIREGAESRFASFLSQHVLWYEDPLLDGWIGFLDDYQILRGEEEVDKMVFLKFLKTEKSKFTNEAALWGFVAGADHFLTRIADLSELLSEEEKPTYALFYAYWLAKFYGYTLTDKGYVRNRKKIHWSEALQNSVRIKYYNAESNKLEKGEASRVDSLKAFELRDHSVQQFWAITRKHLNKISGAIGRLEQTGPAPKKIVGLRVGEALVGDGNEVAHIDLIIGPRGSAAETAFAIGRIEQTGPAPKKIDGLRVGEALVGDGNEVAHIDLIIGPRGSAAETAFANALTNNKDGFTTLLAVVAPNLLVKPPTIIFNKVTITNATQAVQMFGPAQHGVAKAVADSVASGVIPVSEADDLFICVGVFIHWDARDNQKIQDFNYQATKEAIFRAIVGEPTPARVVAQRNVAMHPFAPN